MRQLARILGEVVKVITHSPINSLRLPSPAMGCSPHPSA
jgi:hypothetical protein